MLAERKVKVKWSTNPQNTEWTNDKSKFGYKMLLKMGWSEGKGLGASEDGGLEHIKVKIKCDTSGLGIKKKRDDDWIAGQQEYEDLLAALNSPSVTTGSSVTTDNNDEVFSCHPIKGIVPNSLKRLSYKKTIGSKDLSKKSNKEINCVLGKRQKKLTKHKKFSLKDSPERKFLRICDSYVNTDNSEETAPS